MDQIDIPDYQYYLVCNAKRMVRLTVIKKNGRLLVEVFRLFENFILKRLFENSWNIMCNRTLTSLLV